MRLMIFATLLFLLTASAAVLWRSPWTYATQDRDQPSAGVTHQHVAGTDDLGRDRLVRMSAALLLGAAGSVAASAVASTAAVGLALAAGFAPLWIGSVLLYLSDFFLTLPWLFLLMMVRSALPFNLKPVQSITVTFVLLAILGVPAFIRLHTMRVRYLRHADWRLQDCAAGIRFQHSVLRLLPHLRPMLMMQFVLYIPACLIAEANLGTLGLGMSEPIASWGSMLQSLQSTAFLSESHLIYLPLLLLVLVLTCLELLTSDETDKLA